MENIRKNPPASVAGKKVLAIRDYSTSLRTVLATGEQEKILLPVSNVIYMELEDGNNFIVRPSGTEPKIKLYCLLKGKTPQEVDELSGLIKKDIAELVK